MTQRILTTEQYQALEAAERVLYASQPGCLAWTDVRDRHDSDVLAGMWDDAEVGLQMVEEPENLEAATAERVARAQFFLIFGYMPD
jgi:hypothetical protein